MADDVRSERLERQLHEQNMARFRSLEDGQEKHTKMLGDQNTVLTQIAENTKWMPKLHERVRALENQRNYVVGGASAVGGIWGVVWTILHFFTGK